MQTCHGAGTHLGEGVNGEKVVLGPDEDGTGYRFDQLYIGLVDGRYGVHQCWCRISRGNPYMDGLQ